MIVALKTEICGGDGGQQKPNWAKCIDQDLESGGLTNIAVREIYAPQCQEAAHCVQQERPLAESCPLEQRSLFPRHYANSHERQCDTGIG